jgi:hypothetical protein
MKMKIWYFSFLFFLTFYLKSQPLPELRPCKEGELFGYCNPQGLVKIPHQFHKAGPFSGNIAPVVRDDMYWWFLHKDGHFCFNSRKWSDQPPLQSTGGLYKVAYFDPVFANVVEYYNRNGLPVKVWKEDSLQADTIPYFIFSFQKAAQRAKAKLGTPYAEGQLDCSGFIRYIYEPFGIQLPYFAREIAETGREIPLQHIQPGDLIFFSGSALQDKTVQHVGMVLSVKGKQIEFIHASTSKGVSINFNTDAYYKERFLFVRRIFG